MTEGSIADVGVSSGLVSFVSRMQKDRNGLNLGADSNTILSCKLVDHRVDKTLEMKNI